MQVQFDDNSGAILAALKAQTERALEEIGQAVEGYAVMKTPVDTARLKNSMTHTVQDDTVFVGTNVEYGVYVEYGTGKYASNGHGRPGWWVYVADENGGEKRTASGIKKIYTEEEARKIVAILRAKGIDAHATQGIKPNHMLRDAVAEHEEQYKRMMERALKDE
jgi:hypothetical protein